MTGLLAFITLSAVLRLIAMLALAWLILWVAIVFIMARMLLRPPRMTDGRAMYFLRRLSPEDLSLPYETTSFTIRDERTGAPLKIAAWWIPHPNSDRCALLIHGYGDAKVGTIAWAPLLHSLGYNILVPDLRAHGESTGLDSTAAYWERHDISQVINQLRQQRPSETQHLILFGISLGAAVATAVAADRDDIEAVILESPYSDYRSAVIAHAVLVAAPGNVFLTPAYWLAQRITGSNFEVVRPADLIPKVRSKVMLIAAGDDPLVNADSAAQLQAAIARRSDASIYWSIPTAYHVEGMRGDYAEYRRRIQSFLESATGNTEPPSSAQWQANQQAPTS